MRLALLPMYVGVFICTQLLTFPSLMAQAPSITQFQLSSQTVGKYEKLEITCDLSATYTNPYDYAQVRLSGTFTSPGGQAVEAEGFFMEPYTGPNSNGQVGMSGNGEFHVRFAPWEEGIWSFTLKVEDTEGESGGIQGSFTCTAPNAGNQGFVRTGNSNYLEFDEGGQFVPVGQNIGWANGNPYRDYKRWLDSLATQDANFFRFCICDW